MTPLNLKITVGLLVASVIVYYLHIYKTETLCNCENCQEKREEFCPSCNIEAFNTTFTNSDISDILDDKRSKNHTNYVISST